MSYSLIERVRERLAAESAPLGSPLRASQVAAAIRAESGGMLGDTEVLANLRVLQTELTGAGILEPLLCADGTTDVLVTAPDAVWVDDGNGLRRSPIRFADEAAVRRLASRLALAATGGSTACRRTTNPPAPMPVRWPSTHGCASSSRLPAASARRDANRRTAASSA
ncbi:MAG: hypothetical protein WCI78_14890, partial [Mycobacterium sp.]